MATLTIKEFEEKIVELNKKHLKDMRKLNENALNESKRLYALLSPDDQLEVRRRNDIAMKEVHEEMARKAGNIQIVSSMPKKPPMTQ